jgi:TolA-binding protein
MKTKVTIFVLFFFYVSTLSAQSKKELNLRIDTIKTALNSEKQVVQNLTVQIQNLDTELEKMNKTMLLLTSQVVKQDSMNTLLRNQLRDLCKKAETIKKVNDSIIALKVSQNGLEIKSINADSKEFETFWLAFSNSINDKAKIYG